MSRVAALALFLGLAFAPDAWSGERARWVVAVGSHQGGPDQDKLRHAAEDALSFVDVMLEVGGVLGDRVTFVQDGDAAEIRRQLGQLAARVAASRAAGEQPEVVFYYSGHSDDRGLTPWGDVLTWRDLRDLIAAVDAEVRIVILDSCASGAFARAKGGRAAAGFLQDAQDAVQGDAYLMSASADESAQESDRLGGSYFTHHLVAGLRGAADTDADNQVTLQEAYAYAYAQTVRSTELSWIGAQHPYYTWDVSGRGEVVLTDLRARDAVLSLAAPLDGTISLRDADGDLVAELRKVNGLAMSYALPAGRYTARLRTTDATFRARVHVSSAGPVTLAADDFEPVGGLEITRVRGPAVAHWNATHPMHVAFAPYLGTYGFRRDVRLAGFGLNAFGALHPEVRGVQLGLWSHTTGDLHGADLEGVVSSVRGAVRGTQIAAITTAGRLAGFQGSAILAHAAGDVSGLQLGAVTWSEGTLQGAQFGVVNYVAGTSASGQDGLQLGALYNRAGHGFRGAQLGLINDATELTGLQFGLFNLASDVDGFQLGLINVARHSDGEALGLLNLIGNGYHSIGLFHDEYAMVSLDVKTGGKHLYTRIRAGFDVVGGTGLAHLGFGVGGHAQFKRVWLDGDVNFILPERTVQATFTEAPGGLDFRFDLTVGVDVSDHFGLYVGPGLGIALNTVGTDPFATDDPRTGRPGRLFVPTFAVPGVRGPDDVVRIWPGYQAGVRVRF